MKSLFLFSLLLATATAAPIDYNAPPHNYLQRTPQDRFTKAMAADAALDLTGELPLLKSLLKKLDIPVSTQLMLFSATSLQSGIINPHNPRALYWNGDTTVGFVPGGRVEIASLDAEAGMVFFISDTIRPGQSPRFVRSDKCLNCHADAPSNHLPGLVLDSVAVNSSGGSLATYRHDEMGHTVPLEQRFGGWHLTGGHHLTKTHANLVSQLDGDKMTTTPNPPGTFCNLQRYPLPTSDILPHLVHEHYVGFINHVVTAIYKAREGDDAQLDAVAKRFADYILFKQEAKLPANGIIGDPGFIRDFQSPPNVLREFDLKTRIFKFPCSYLLLTPTWQAVPPPIRQRVYALVKPVVSPSAAVVSALQKALPDWPK